MRTRDRERAIKGLKDARRLIKKGWCQKVMAEDKSGVCVDYDDETATKFCLIGALAVAFPKSGKACNIACDTIENIIMEVTGKYSSESRFNDSHTKDDVLDLLDQSIKSLQSSKKITRPA